MLEHTDSLHSHVNYMPSQPSTGCRLSSIKEGGEKSGAQMFCEHLPVHLMLMLLSCIKSSAFQQALSGFWEGTAGLSAGLGDAGLAGRITPVTGQCRYPRRCAVMTRSGASGQDGAFTGAQRPAAAQGAGEGTGPGLPPASSRKVSFHLLPRGTCVSRKLEAARSSCLPRRGATTSCPRPRPARPPHPDPAGQQPSTCPPAGRAHIRRHREPWHPQTPTREAPA